MSDCGGPSWCGTPGGYTNHKCRGANCRSAWAKHMKVYKERRRENGGLPLVKSSLKYLEEGGEGKDPEPETNGSGQGIGTTGFSNNPAEVVPTWQLSNALRGWLHRWNPDSKEAGLEFLAEKLGVTQRRIVAIVRVEAKHTGLQMADALLSAMERSELLGLEIDVIPNPQWSQERWVRYMQERGCG